MTPNRRIFLNIVATYGRSLYALTIGLVCGRRTLMSNADEVNAMYLHCSPEMIHRKSKRMGVCGIANHIETVMQPTDGCIISVPRCKHI